MGDFEVKERDSDSFYGRDLKWGLVEAEGGIRWPESQSTPSSAPKPLFGRAMKPQRDKESRRRFPTEAFQSKMKLYGAELSI